MHFIDGKWIETAHESFSTQNPATGEILWQGGSATQEEINHAIQCAQNAFTSWRDINLKERTRYLLRFQTLVTENKDSLAELFSKESGISLWESLDAVDEIIERVTNLIEAFNIRCQHRSLPHLKDTLVTTFKPKGVIALIAIGTITIQSIFDSLLTALLAGNVIVFKGSELIPLTTQSLFLLLEKSAIPPAAINLIQGKNETAQLLSKHPLLDGLIFAGIVSDLSFPYHKILTLEAEGDNNSIVVHEAEDFEAASYITILSAFITTGQRSTCARRLIVVESKKNRQFVQTLASMIESLRIGPYTNDPKPFMGPLISQANKERALSIQALLGTSGGKPIVELRSLSKEHPFVSAGLIDITQGKYLEEENYSAPLLQLIWVKDFEEAIKVANQGKNIHVSSLLTQEPAYFDIFLKKIKASTLNLNCPTTRFNKLSRYLTCDKTSDSIISLQNKNIIIPAKVAPGIEFLAIT